MSSSADTRPAQTATGLDRCPRSVHGGNGNPSSFVTTPDDLIINPALIDYVSTFVPKSSGERFNPHVTTGIATREFLDQVLKEPFDSFAFAPSGLPSTILGNYGTARKQLKALELKP